VVSYRAQHYIRGDDEGHRNDLHRLELSDAVSWAALESSGPPPKPREMHATAVIVGGAAADGASSSRSLLVHGGRSGDEILSDLCLLDLLTLTWATPVVSPCQRVGHAALALARGPDAPSGAAQMLIFGGFNGAAFNNEVWSISLRAPPAVVERVPASAAPEKRFAHGFAALGSTLYVFGGSARENELADLACADAAAVLDV